jgi:hypothetical protein
MLTVGADEQSCPHHPLFPRTWTPHPTTPRSRQTPANSHYRPGAYPESISDDNLCERGNVPTDRPVDKLTGMRARYASSEAPAASMNTDFRLAAYASRAMRWASGGRTATSRAECCIRLISYHAHEHVINLWAQTGTYVGRRTSSASLGNRACNSVSSRDWNTAAAAARPPT